MLQEHFVSSIFFHLLAFFSVNTLNDLAAISPRPKTNATALILWIQTCLFYIVAAMAEYALLLTSRCWIPYIENKRYFGQLLKSTLDRLDKCMVILFPIVFFIHSFVFWKSVESYYWPPYLETGECRAYLGFGRCVILNFVIKTFQLK